MVYLPTFTIIFGKFVTMGPMGILRVLILGILLLMEEIPKNHLGCIKSCQ